MKSTIRGNLLGLSESLNQNALAIEKLVQRYKHLVVVDKKLALYKLSEQGNAIKVDQRFFSTFGVQASDLRYLEYFLYDEEHSTYLYYGSWKWSNERLEYAPCDHIGIFSTDKHLLSLDHLIFSGYDTYGNKCASYDSTTGKLIGKIRVSTPTWHQRQRMGFWIDTHSITNGSILATVHVAGQSDDKIHMQYDTNQSHRPTKELGGYVEKRGLGFSVTWHNEETPNSTMYSDGVGNFR